jgi:transposase InsO family protein
MEKLHANYSVGALADALNVSRSGFYAHRQKPTRPRRVRDALLAPLIAQSFARSRRTYGSPRVLCDLRDLGERCGKNRVARLMNAQGLRARQKRRFTPRTTDSRHEHPIAANWLARVPAPDRPGMVWQSDFTYIETAEGWLYLAFTLDGCTRRCVAHHCRADMRGELTTETLALALRRQPPPPGLLHHSDRGSQYAADAFARLAATHGITLSMSRTGNPYDNALAESFVATLKAECFGHSIPPTRAAAELMAFDYIETFYNSRRRHSSLGHLSPRDFHSQMFPHNQDNITN